MDQLKRSLGAILVLLGVILLAIYSFAELTNNAILVVVAILFVAGIGSYIFLNKKFIGNGK